MEWGTTYSGLLVPEHIARKPKAIDLFCGAGGFSLGFIQAGWEIVGAVECDPYAAITYLTNLGSNPINMHFVSSGDEKRFREAMIQEVKRSYDKEI